MMAMVSVSATATREPTAAENISGPHDAAHKVATEVSVSPIEKMPDRR